MRWPTRPLPGICLMYMLTGTRSSELLLVGGAIAGLVGVGVLIAIYPQSRSRSRKPALGSSSACSSDSASCCSRISSTPTTPARAGSTGSSSARRQRSSRATCERWRSWRRSRSARSALLFKELKLLAFDPDFAATLGMRTGLLGAVLAGLLVMAVMIGLQTVGVILMVSLLIAPAVAARQWMGSLVRAWCCFPGCSGWCPGLPGAVPEQPRRPPADRPDDRDCRLADRDGVAAVRARIAAWYRPLRNAPAAGAAIPGRARLDRFTTGSVSA